VAWIFCARSVNYPTIDLLSTIDFVDVHPWPERFYCTHYTQLSDMTYIAVDRAVTITCDSCSVKFQPQGNGDHRAAIRALLGKALGVLGQLSEAVIVATYFPRGFRVQQARQGSGTGNVLYSTTRPARLYGLSDRCLNLVKRHPELTSPGAASGVTKIFVNNDYILPAENLRALHKGI
jgi:hypothetical protein